MDVLARVAVLCALRSVCVRGLLWRMRILSRRQKEREANLYYKHNTNDRAHNSNIPIVIVITAIAHERERLEDNAPKTSSIQLQGLNTDMLKNAKTFKIPEGENCPRTASPKPARERKGLIYETKKRGVVMRDAKRALRKLLKNVDL